MRQGRSSSLSVSTTKTTTTTTDSSRSGFLQWLLDRALESPLWKHVLVPQARQKIVQTAMANGIDWMQAKEWLESQPGPWREPMVNHHDRYEIPEYYIKSFHAYENGNLCWDAALEAEIASAAVGARNFPKFGVHGESAFRDAFDASLARIVPEPVPDKAIMVDLGCGVGTSTRRLAQNHPQAAQIVGLDMSPYFVEVGKTLLELEPNSMFRNATDGGTWINSIERDERIELRVGDAAKTGIASDSVDVVNLQFVAHELPSAVTLEVLREAHRILKPHTGQLWFCEMDFETPAYAAQRSNALLFALIRSTEPYLDDYADHAPAFRALLANLFATTTIAPATGRHFAIVSRKGDNNDKNGVLTDLRFDEHGVYRVEDTHLQVWENKD